MPGGEVRRWEVASSENDVIYNLQFGIDNSWAPVRRPA
jgi:hypothetical protein